MKASDCRIGNFIQNQGTELQICQIFTDSFQGMFVGGKGSYTFEYSKGIPLTEEWLLKFGFEPNGVYHSMRLPINDLTNEGNRSFIVCTYDNSGDGWLEIIAKRGTSKEPTFIELQTDIIKLLYVHQLQNLYFALTGNELTVKNQ